MIFVTHDQVEAMTLADRIVVMNNRRIEQVGTPLEIYERPASRFVAEFVGAPPMNMLDVMMESGNGGETVVMLKDGTRLALPIARPGAGTALFGIRAEDLMIAADGPLSGRVQVVEHLGDRTLLHVALASGETLVAADAGRSRIAVGDGLALAPVVERTHLFDGDGLAHHAVAGVTQ